MNINLLNHTKHIDTIITLPTRITGSSAKLLDHIVINIADDAYDSGNILSDISDHFPVFYIRLSKDKSVNTVKTFRKLDAPSISRFKQC